MSVVLWCGTLASAATFEMMLWTKAEVACVSGVVASSYGDDPD